MKEINQNQILKIEPNTKQVDVTKKFDDSCKAPAIWRIIVPGIRSVELSFIDGPDHLQDFVNGRCEVLFMGVPFLITSSTEPNQYEVNYTYTAISIGDCTPLEPILNDHTLKHCNATTDNEPAQPQQEAEQDPFLNCHCPYCNGVNTCDIVREERLLRWTKEQGKHCGDYWVRGSVCEYLCSVCHSVHTKLHRDSQNHRILDGSVLDNAQTVRNWLI